MDYFSSVSPELTVFNSHITNKNDILNVCENDEAFYCQTSEQSFEHSKSSKSWEAIPTNSGIIKKGQSMTSIPYGIAYFGGQGAEGFVTNEFWVYEHHVWQPIFNNIKGRKYHNAVFIEKTNSLVIIGGKDDKEVLENNVIINMKNYEVKELKFDHELKFTRHSLTYIDNNKICLFGGMDKDNNPNESLYIIDIETKKVKVINTYLPFYPNFNHSTAYIDGLFIVITPPPNISCWGFDLNFSIWLKLDLDNVLSETRFLFIKGNKFVLVNKELDKIANAEIDDINIFKEKMITYNINSDLYLFDDEKMKNNYKDLLETRKSVTMNLINQLSNVVPSLNPVTSVLDQIQLYNDFADLEYFKTVIEKTNVNKKKEENQKLPKTNKTPLELFNDIQLLKEEINNRNNQYNELIQSSFKQIQNNNISYILNCKTNTDDSKERFQSMKEQSSQFSNVIKNQHQTIKQLQEKISKLKKASYYNTIISTTEKLDKSNEKLYASKIDYNHKFEEFIKARIKLNNAKLNELLINDEILKKRTDTINMRQKLLSDKERLYRIKRYKKSKLNQLSNDVSNIFCEDCTSKNAEILCRQSKKVLYELSNWLNESASEIGANQYVDAINFDQQSRTTRKANKVNRTIQTRSYSEKNKEFQWKTIVNDTFNVLKLITEKDNMEILN